MLVAIGKLEALVAIAQRAGENVDARPAHLQELRGPERVLESIVFHVGNAGVEARLRELPALRCTDVLCEGEHVVVWEVVAKGGARCVEEILSVHKRDGPFDCGFSGHRREKITPSGPFGVSDGE